MSKLDINNARLSIDVADNRLTLSAKTRTRYRNGGHVSWPSTAGPHLTRPQRHTATHKETVDNRNAATLDVWQTATLADVCAYLEHQDHSDLRKRLAIMAGTVAAAVATYGDWQQRIVEVHRIFPALREALWTHMFREEHGLYSSIVYLDENHIELSCPSGLVTRAIRAIRRDHRYFRSAFRRIAQLLDNYDIPVNSGQRYVNLVHGLRDLESSKLEHMRKEHLVYARALALERQIRRK